MNYYRFFFFYRCQICLQNDSSCSPLLFTSPASLAPSGNEVLCQKTRFNSNDPTPAIIARLRVVWNNQRTIDNPNNASGIMITAEIISTVILESMTNCAKKFSNRHQSTMTTKFPPLYVLLLIIVHNAA